MNVRIFLSVCCLLLATVTLQAEEATHQSAAPLKLAPQPTKPSALNVQNGTVQFGIVQYGPPQSGAVQYAPPGGQLAPFGMPGMGSMAAPPAAQPRMLRVRVALFAGDDQSKLPEWSLGPAKEMPNFGEVGFKLIDSYDLTIVTGHATKAQRGSQQPVVTGSQFVPQRGVDGRSSAMRTNQYTMQSFGTMLSVAPEMVGKRAMLKLTFESSRLVQADAEGDDDEKEDDIKETHSASDEPPSTATMMIDTQVLLESGQATLLAIRDSRGVKHALVIAVEMLDSGEAGADAEAELMKNGGFF